MHYGQLHKKGKKFQPNMNIFMMISEDDEDDCFVLLLTG
jgi:hypothetical protein